MFAFPFDQQNSMDCIKKMGLGFVVFFISQCAQRLSTNEIKPMNKLVDR